MDATHEHMSVALSPIDPATAASSGGTQGTRTPSGMRSRTKTVDKPLAAPHRFTFRGRDYRSKPCVAS
jgi:hypothetical protein